MKTKIKTTVILELVEEEVNWLKEIIQNPIGCTTSDEELKDSKMRKLFWDALTYPEVNSNQAPQVIESIFPSY